MAIDERLKERSARRSSSRDRRRRRAPRFGFCSIERGIAHGDTFHNDRQPDLKTHFIPANPPLTGATNLGT